VEVDPSVDTMLTELQEQILKNVSIPRTQVPLGPSTERALLVEYLANFPLPVLAEAFAKALGKALGAHELLGMPSSSAPDLGALGRMWRESRDSSPLRLTRHLRPNLVFSQMERTLRFIDHSPPRIIGLTGQESTVLGRLLEREGEVCSHTDLLDSLHCAGLVRRGRVKRPSQTVAMIISGLRDKVSDFELIRTVRGVGYTILPVLPGEVT
jgi:hypothetical protein